MPQLNCSGAISFQEFVRMFFFPLEATSSFRWHKLHSKIKYKETLDYHTVLATHPSSRNRRVGLTRASRNCRALQKAKQKQLSEQY